MANDKVKIATSKFTALADAVRAKSGGTTESLSLADIPAIIPTLSVPTWADGSWDDIAEALDKHEKGAIDLYSKSGWEIGSAKTVPIAAMAATGVGESHVAQNIEMILMDKNVIDLAAGGKCNFVIGMKDCLADANNHYSEGGYMNPTSTNAGGWKNSARRTWCNNVFVNAVPNGLKSLVKNASIKTSAGYGTTTIDTTTDTWFLPCAYNVSGKNDGVSYTGEDTVQWEWYKTKANWLKKPATEGYEYGGEIYGWWFLRSPSAMADYMFCGVHYQGSLSMYYAEKNAGLSLHACI